MACETPPGACGLERHSLPWVPREKTMRRARRLQRNQPRQPNCFRFASSASALEDQWPCGKELCNFSSEAFVRANVRSLASYWPRPWSDFGVTLGARRLPKGSPENSKRQPQTTQTVSLECLWAAFWGPGLPRGAGGLKETTRATQKGPPPAEARRF